MTEQTEMHGRVALVTGASSGIGRAIAAALDSQGVRLVLTGRDNLRLSAAVSPNSNVAQVTGDIRDANIRAQCFDASVANFGTPPDLVVLCAGRGLRGSILDSDSGSWRDLLETNVLATFELLRLAVLKMRSLPQGTRRDVIIIGTVVASNVSPFSSVYGASKAALAMGVEALRREVAPEGIRVTVVNPGFVRSGFQRVAGYDPGWVDTVESEKGPLLTPDDVARAVCFALEQPAHVNVGSIEIRPVRQDYP